VMVMRQVTIPSAAIPADVTVDALPLPEKRLTSQIAMDLNQRSLSTPSTVFEAEWQPRTPLAEMAQRNFRR